MSSVRGVRERLSVIFFVLVVLGIVVVGAFAAGYLLGKLLL